MTRKGGAPRCPVCGYATEQEQCRRGHGAPRSLHSNTPVTAGRGLPPLDVLQGVIEVVRSVFTIVHDRAFVGLLGRPMVINAIVFLALSAGFWFGLMPAYADTTADDQETAFWTVATWLLLAPLVLELLAGPAQAALRQKVSEVVLGIESPTAPGPAVTSRLRDRAIFVVVAAVLLPFGLAIAQIPWAGLPLLIVFGAAVAAVVWFDPPLRDCGYDLRSRLDVLWYNRWRALGVGAGLQLLTAVPFVNLLLLPSLAAVAADSAFVRFDKRTSTVAPPP